MAQSQHAIIVQYSIIYDWLKVKGKKEWRQSRLFIWVIPPEGRIVFRSVDLKPLLQQNTSLSELAANAPSVVPVASGSPSVVTTTPESEQEITPPSSQKTAIILLIIIASTAIAIAIWYGRFILNKKAAISSRFKPQQ